MGGSEKMNIKCVQLLCSGSLWILLHNPVRLVLTSDLHMSAREVNICLMSHFSKSGTCAHSCPTHCQPTNVAHQAPPWDCPRQEYWSGLPFPPSGDLSDPGVEPISPALQADSLPSEPPGKPWQINLPLSHMGHNVRKW